MDKNKPHKIEIFLASPYGFTEGGREFMNNTLIREIQDNFQDSFKVLNPWDDFESDRQEVEKIKKRYYNDTEQRESELLKYNERVANKNERQLSDSQIIIAVLDGSDVDSGVAAEIGYAGALNRHRKKIGKKEKKIIGYRSDFRLTGDNLGAAVNLQVQHFIKKSGCDIVRSKKELIDQLGKFKESLKP
jgi:nucleoside 2-deoxyribosyltransferase